MNIPITRRKLITGGRETNGTKDSKLEINEKTCLLSIHFAQYLMIPNRKMNFSAFVEQLSQMMRSNVYLISKEGQVIGRKQRSEIVCDPFSQFLLRGFLSFFFTHRLLSLKQTYSSEQRKELFLHPEWKNFFTLGHSLLVPLWLEKKQRGVLIFYRQKKPFVSDEIALGEYAATLFCIAMWKKEEESARGMRNQYDKVDQEMDERR